MRMYVRFLKTPAHQLRTGLKCSPELLPCLHSQNSWISSFIHDTRVHQKHTKCGEKAVWVTKSFHHKGIGHTFLRSCLSVSCQRRTVMSAPSLAAAAMPVDSANNRGGLLGWYESVADTAPVHLAENQLLALQEATGLPWWANIICATVILRTAVTLPLAVYQMYIIAKVENLQTEIDTLAKQLRYEVAVYGKQHGWTEKTAKFHFKKNLRRIISGLYVRDNCHPFKASLLIWIQIPMWVFVSLALRNFSTAGASFGVESVRMQLAEGGVLWFPDLTLPDSTWIIPISLGVLNLLIVEIFAVRKLKLSRFQKYVTNFIRAISVAMIPIAATVPSSMALYWMSSSCVGLAHNLLLKSPTIRRACRLPSTKSDSDAPYHDIATSLYEKYFFKK